MFFILFENRPKIHVMRIWWDGLGQVHAAVQCKHNASVGSIGREGETRTTSIKVAQSAIKNDEEECSMAYPASSFNPTGRYYSNLWPSWSKRSWRKPTRHAAPTLTLTTLTLTINHNPNYPTYLFSTYLAYIDRPIRGGVRRAGMRQDLAIPLDPE